MVCVQVVDKFLSLSLSLSLSLAAEDGLGRLTEAQELLNFSWSPGGDSMMIRLPSGVFRINSQRCDNICRLDGKRLDI